MDSSKWAKEIISLQKSDGSWGYFHTLSSPTRSQPITTEQALRRLKILGLTEKDEPIQKAIKYLESCLNGATEIPDRKEKFRDWPILTTLMFATWLKIFLPHHPLALDVAKKWANIIEIAFDEYVYGHNNYMKAFTETFGIKPHNGRSIDFVSFYQVSLLQGMLKPQTEEKVINYIINKDTGIYYIYDSKIADLPNKFASKQASRYLSAIELLAGYDYTKKPLSFMINWINEHKNNNGYWDLGTAAKDGIYFPRSDSWRNKHNRIADCTARIKELLVKLGVFV